MNSGVTPWRPSTSPDGQRRCFQQEGRRHGLEAARPPCRAPAPARASAGAVPVRCAVNPCRWPGARAAAPPTRAGLLQHLQGLLPRHVVCSAACSRGYALGGRGAADRQHALGGGCAGGVGGKNAGGPPRSYTQPAGHARSQQRAHVCARLQLCVGTPAPRCAVLCCTYGQTTRMPAVLPINPPTHLHAPCHSLALFSWISCFRAKPTAPRTAPLLLSLPSQARLRRWGLPTHPHS